MTEYMIERKKRMDDQMLKDYSVFGQLGGLIFCIIGFMKWLTTYNEVLASLLVIIIAFGLYLMVSGIVFPQSIAWFYKLFSFVGNKIGNIIFGILLTVVYLVFLIPVSRFIKRKKGKYLYLSWNGEYPGNEKTGFISWMGTDIADKKGMLGTMTGLMGTFINHGQQIFVPIVVLLVILGVILFFVSSSVMAPFIYTLF